MGELPTDQAEVDGEEFAATARPTSGADRDALFARVSERYPFFTDHQNGVERTIPVVELVRATPAR